MTIEQPLLRPLSRPATLWRRWVAAVTVGEFLGFLAPATAAAATAHAGAGVTAAAMLTAGAVEGAVLGAFQSSVLRSALPHWRTAPWIGVTAAAAVVAWTLGMMPMLFGEQVARWPLWVQIPAVVAAGLVVVFSLGVAQWTVLRHYCARAALWPWGNAIGWIAGLCVFTAVTTPWWQPGQSAAQIAAIGAVGGLAMAAAVAVVTGVFLVRTIGEGEGRTRG